MFKREYIKFIVIGVVAVTAFLAMADFEPEQPDVFVGTWHDGRMAPAPDFTLPSLDGDTLTLSDLRGHVVVVNIWATWCAPCRDEMPDFVRLQEEFRQAGVRFVGVSIDAGGFADIEPFAREFDANYPLVLDDGSVYGVWRGSTGVPTTYLIDREGRIVHYWPGALAGNVLRPALRDMLQG